MVARQHLLNMVAVGIMLFALLVSLLLAQDVLQQKALAGAPKSPVINEVAGYVSQSWGVREANHTEYYLQLKGSKTTYKIAASSVDRKLEQGLPVIVDYVVSSGTLLSALDVEVIS